MAVKQAEDKNASVASEKQKALDAALAQIEKQFGKGAVMRLGQHSTLNVEAIPTGSLSLDIALGSAVCPRDASSRSMDRKAAVRPPWHCILSLSARSGAVRLCSSM